jgi:hypothetical protein
MYKCKDDFDTMKKKEFDGSKIGLGSEYVKF